MTTLRDELAQKIVALLTQTTMMHPAVAARFAVLRAEVMPELRLLAVLPDGAALGEYQTDDGEWLKMIVPVRRPDRPH